MDSSRGVVRFRPKAERVIRIEEYHSIALFFGHLQAVLQ